MQGNNSMLDAYRIGQEELRQQKWLATDFHATFVDAWVGGKRPCQRPEALQGEEQRALQRI